MPACPRDNDYPTSIPPGFSANKSMSKHKQLMELLEKVTEKYRQEPDAVDESPKQIELLFSIAQYTLLSAPASNDDRRNFLQQIVHIGEDLLSESQVHAQPITTASSVHPNTIMFDIPHETSPIVETPLTTSNETGDLSLDDLMNEYLQDEIPPSTAESNEKSVLDREDISATIAEPTANSVLSTLVCSPTANESLFQSPLESILFSNHLSSQDAADDADSIWKVQSSSFGQIFCKKSSDVDLVAKKRISSCLLDRSLYERLTRLIYLLPKQYIPNSVQPTNLHMGRQQRGAQYSNARSSPQTTGGPRQNHPSDRYRMRGTATNPNPRPRAPGQINIRPQSGPVPPPLQQHQQQHNTQYYSGSQQQRHYPQGGQVRLHNDDQYNQSRGQARHYAQTSGRSQPHPSQRQQNPHLAGYSSTNDQRNSYNNPGGKKFPGSQPRFKDNSK